MSTTMRQVLIRAILFFLAVAPSVCNAQKFDGFVITESDSLIKGYMRTSIEHTGRKKIEITQDKRKKPHAYYPEDIRYYGFKKDTFAILKNFYPFAGEDYFVELLEAKVVISKGAVRMYSVALQKYTVQPRILPGPGVVTMFVKADYATYVLEDNLHVKRALKKEKKEFYDSVEPIVGDDVDLMSRIRNKELNFKDIKEIVAQYNRTKRLKRYKVD